MEIEKTREECLKEFDDKIKQATDDDVEIEIRDAFLAKAEYLFKREEYEEAQENYEKALTKTVGSLK